jgi:hypothetical protein
MHEGSSAAEQLRLGVVAALLSGSDGHEADSATADEQQIAGALRGGPSAAARRGTAAVTELLRLADGTSASTSEEFTAGLLQTFLLPDDSRHALAVDTPATAFADIYRRLALPCLPAERGQRAQAILADLAS